MSAAIRQAPGASDGAAHGRRVRALVGGCSIEISPRDDFAGERLRELLAPGTRVFVNHPGSITHHDIVAACAKLRHGGFDPVPHIAVRRLASFTQASDFLQRAAGEADVNAAMIIGGDPDYPAGPFPDSYDLLASGLVERHGLREVAFAGYPEGHPRIASRTLDEALRAKVASARGRGLEVSLVTQFGFEAEPILRWIASALARGHTAFARILAEAGPDTLIDALVAGEDPGWPIDGLHVFTFGGIRRTAEWMRATTTLSR